MPPLQLDQPLLRGRRRRPRHDTREVQERCVRAPHPLRRRTLVPRLVLVAGTDRGICTIELGDTRQHMRQRLANPVPEGRAPGRRPAFAAWVTQVLAMIKAPGCLDLPLDIRARPPEAGLGSTPDYSSGATTTYAAIARQNRTPQAVRAVAGACAQIPWPWPSVSPCHPRRWHPERLPLGS